MNVARDASEDPYEYDGYLVFNGLFSTNVLNPDFDLEEVVEKELKDFSTGSIDKPGDGYRVLPFTTYVQDNHRIGPNLESNVSDIKSFRYRWEEWEEQEVGGESGLETRPVRESKSVDVYWHFPDFLFIKGNKTQTTKTADLIDLRLGDYVKTKEIQFTPDFLLWILSKYRNNQDLTDNLRANLLHDARIEGEEDRFGQSNVVDNSTDIAQAPNILMGILRGKEMTALEGIFETEGMFVNAELETDGRVHVKAEQDIHGAEPVERMSITLTFLIELLSLYEQWEGLDPDDKYPPIEFFEEIYEECRTQGAEITFPVDEVIDLYRQKGSRDEYQERQTGLGEYRG